MPVAISNDVKISVETYYQNDKVKNAHGNHMFAYRIVIENKSDYTIKLLRRHWDIIDSYEGLSEVDGEGVVGEQPILEPNEKYTYVSGCALIASYKSSKVGIFLIN
jgi:ApaG protein